MNIKWLGHSCFVITSKSGIITVTDPFDESVGYKIPNLKANIVTTSHNHFDHNYTNAIIGDFELVNTLGNNKISDIEITGFSSFHDKENGSKRGENIIFKFIIDNLNICHCGDLGHLLNLKMISELGRIDILMLPVGGVYTIDYIEASELVNQLKPSIIIPMHYKTPLLKFELDEVDKFLNNIKNCDVMHISELNLDAESLPTKPQVVVMEYI